MVSGWVRVLVLIVKRRDAMEGVSACWRLVSRRWVMADSSSKAMRSSLVLLMLRSLIRMLSFSNVQACYDFINLFSTPLSPRSFLILLRMSSAEGTSANLVESISCNQMRRSRALTSASPDITIDSAPSLNFLGVFFCSLIASSKLCICFFTSLAESLSFGLCGLSGRSSFL